MIIEERVYMCTNTNKHKDRVWVRMELSPRSEYDFSRVIGHCPQCMSSFAIDLEMKIKNE